MNRLTITAGVTTYNAQETILDALNSIVNQTVEIAQIIVVDDKSSDNTLSILEKFDLSHRLEIYQNSANSGVAVSRNEIIKHAKGEFIVFFDDDDISSSERVNSQLDRILEYERDYAKGAPVICHTARKQVYPNGVERIEPTMGCRLGYPAPSGPMVARRALMGEPMADAYGSCATCSQMARTSTYRMLGGFDEAFRRCEDSDLAIRLALAGGHFAGVAEPHVAQKMTQTTDKSLDHVRFYKLSLLEKHQNLFDNKTMYEFCRKWIILKFDWFANKRALFAMRLMLLGVVHPVLTMKRLLMSIPAFGGNRAFSRFHRGST